MKIVVLDNNGQPTDQIVSIGPKTLAAILKQPGVTDAWPWIISKVTEMIQPLVEQYSDDVIVARQQAAMIQTAAQIVFQAEQSKAAALVNDAVTTALQPGV